MVDCALDIHCMYIYKASYIIFALTPPLYGTLRVGTSLLTNLLTILTGSIGTLNLASH